MNTMPNISQSIPYVALVLAEGYVKGMQSDTLLWQGKALVRHVVDRAKTILYEYGLHYMPSDDSYRCMDINTPSAYPELLQQQTPV